VDSVESNCISLLSCPFFPWVQAIEKIFWGLVYRGAHILVFLEPPILLVMLLNSIDSVWILDRHWFLFFCGSPKTVAPTEKFKLSFWHCDAHRFWCIIRFLTCHMFELCIDMRSLLNSSCK
jgi:hypothetical protein